MSAPPKVVLPLELLFRIAFVDVDTYRAMLPIVGAATLGEKNQKWIRGVFVRKRICHRKCSESGTLETTYTLCGKLIDWNGQSAVTEALGETALAQRLNLDVLEKITEATIQDVSFFIQILSDFAAQNKEIALQGTAGVVRKWADGTYKAGLLLRSKSVRLRFRAGKLAARISCDKNGGSLCLRYSVGDCATVEVEMPPDFLFWFFSLPSNRILKRGGQAAVRVGRVHFFCRLSALAVSRAKLKKVRQGNRQWQQ